MIHACYNSEPATPETKLSPDPTNLNPNENYHITQSRPQHRHNHRIFYYIGYSSRRDSPNRIICVT